MGIFKGKRRVGYFLKSEKFKRRYSSMGLIQSRKNIHLNPYASTRESPKYTSTPLRPKRLRVISTKKSPYCKRARIVSPVVPVAGKSVLVERIKKQSKKSLNFEDHSRVNDMADSWEFELDYLEETVLYSEGPSIEFASFEKESKESKEEPLIEFASFEKESKESKEEPLIEFASFENENKENESHFKLFEQALNVLESNNLKSEFLKFLNLVASNKFPLDNVSFQLFIDLVKLLDTGDIRAMRYNTTSLNFFWLGKRLFGSRFLRFMGGPKAETQLLLGNINLDPSVVKINFATPSTHILDSYNPLGFHLTSEKGPGLNKDMIDMAAKTNTESLSYVIMFDGKKVKRGGERDLLGFEENPAKVRKQNLKDDLEAVTTVISEAERIYEHIDNGERLEPNAQFDMYQSLRGCIMLFSKYIIALRRLKKRKENALANYKEKIVKDPSAAKTLQYAMDSCRTAIYQTDNTLSSFMDIQWEICRAGAYLNGKLHLFANKNGSLNLETQQNVKLLSDQYDENTPTCQIKQRTTKWYNDRKEVKVSGSTLYTAVGCDGLKKLQQHFDHVVSGVDKDQPSESQRKAMDHGTMAEIHQIATLSGIIAPFLFPSITFCEEGYYIQDDIIVSPDGSLRDEAGKVVFAFEGKAPSLKTKSPEPIQHYQVPNRYVIQTVFEQEVLDADKGTLYMCWTAEGSTLFRIPPSKSIVNCVKKVVEDIYKPKVPKRPVRRHVALPEINAKIKDHVQDCEFLGEYPSITAITNASRQPYAENERNEYSFHDLICAMLKAKKAMKESYDLQTIPASQVLVYLLADLDRLWKPEVPHAIPVMHCYRGYSLSMEIARELVEKCVKACTEKGLHVAAVSSDGEFIQLMVQGNAGQPLTLRQLSKQVWEKISKLKKQELIKLIKSINTSHTVTKDDTSNGLIVESNNKVFRLRTPVRGWKNKKNKASLSEMASPSSQAASATDESNTDDTILYDTEALIFENCQHNIQIGTKEAEDICYLLRQLNQSKWKNTTPEMMIKTMEQSLHTLLKNELIEVAKYLNLQLRGTGNEIPFKNKKKCDLIKEIASVLQYEVKDTSNAHTSSRKKKAKKTYKLKSLRDIACDILTKSSYPKQVLNIAYSEYIWPNEVNKFRKEGRVAEQVCVKGQYPNEEFYFEPYYTPPYDNGFMVYTYDKTHMGTNLRKSLCLDKVHGISIEAWKAVSKFRTDLLHPTIIEVTDGKIVDQMKESLARTMVSGGVEDEMRRLGFEPEADFCQLIRKGLYEADDLPGVPAYERCLQRYRLMQWLQKGVNFGQFPPYGGTIKGLSYVLYEGLRTSLEAKLYLYTIANAGTYCVRAPNTLCSESFFGTMQEMDPWGQGILSVKGVEKHLNDFTTITSMKMDETRNIYIKTKKDAAYPNPTVLDDVETDRSDSSMFCECKREGFIRCIITRNHFFDTQARARLNKPEKPYQPGRTDRLRGEQPIRARYGYKINEAKMLPSKRLAIQIDADDDFIKSK